MNPSFEFNTAGSAPATDASYVAPRNPLEEELVRIWQNLLEIPNIGVNDDFFELGGHSLLAIEIRAGIREVLGAPQLPVNVLDTPTVASMAAAIFAKLTPAVS